MYSRRMKRQIANRLGLPHIHHVLEQFCDQKITAAQACEALGVGRTRLYELRGAYGAAKASKQLKSWHPGVSGGNHAAPWDSKISEFLRQAILAGYNYAFAASETERKFDTRLARSQVRRWAIQEGAAPAPKPARLPSHLRRWQRQAVGEIWQLDATPEHWFGKPYGAYPLLDMIDDCSRFQVGCAIYRNENIPAYVHFLHDAFMRYGLPLEIYVDYAGIFAGHKEGSVTQLAERLRFYEISFVFANTPEAKGKVERVHQVWQDRLPPYFALNGLNSDSDLQEVNSHIQTLREHRNRFEKHRELGMFPQQAWDGAIAEGRSKLRPIPKDPWWHFVWAIWHPVVVAQGGRIHFRDQVLPTRGSPGSRAVLCAHLDGTISVIKERPNKQKYPIVLFSNRPKTS